MDPSPDSESDRIVVKKSTAPRSAGNSAKANGDGALPTVLVRIFIKDSQIVLAWQNRGYAQSNPQFRKWLQLACLHVMNTKHEEFGQPIRFLPIHHSTLDLKRARSAAVAPEFHVKQRPEDFVIVSPAAPPDGWTIEGDGCPSILLRHGSDSVASFKIFLVEESGAVRVKSDWVNEYGKLRRESEELGKRKAGVERKLAELSKMNPGPTMTSEQIKQAIDETKKQQLTSDEEEQLKADRIALEDLTGLREFDLTIDSKSASRLPVCELHVLTGTNG